MCTVTTQITELRTTCCIAGGGPAGLMLGYLLARAGVDVLVLEKHADFLRDFRGDTIHPSTLELMYELGLLEPLLQLPHTRMHSVHVMFEGQRIVGPDFAHLPTQCRFIAFMPQWDFLNFLAQEAGKLQNFRLLMQAEVLGVVASGDSATSGGESMGEGRVQGVHVRVPDGELRVYAHLCVAADGRASTLRAAAGMQPDNLGVAIDALWLRIPKPAGAGEEALMHLRKGRMLIAIDRGDYWQCGFIIRKGAFEQLQAAGLPAFKAQIAETYPATREGLDALASWADVHLLTVQVNRLRKWHRDGLLCIGDAAHAMSPAGGVGINLAIQDAVATANLLVDALRELRVTEAALAAVQKRRERATRRMQRIQVIAHARLAKALGTGRAIRVPWLLSWVLPVVAPVLRRLGARVIGLGFQPEHVSPAIVAGRRIPIDADA